MRRFLPLALVAALVLLAGCDSAVKDAGTTPGYTAPPDDRPDALFIGDSYTEGNGATSPATGYAAQVVEHFGWRASVDAQGSTGFLNPGVQNNGLGRQTVLARVEAIDPATFSPTLTIVVDAGLNDTASWIGAGKGTLAGERVAVIATFTKLRDDFPRAKIVGFGVWDVGVIPLSHQVDRLIESAVKMVGGRFFSPIDEDWTPGQQHGKYIDSDHTHPNQAGHDRIAAAMERDLVKAGVTA